MRLCKTIVGSAMVLIRLETIPLDDGYGGKRIAFCSNGSARKAKDCSKSALMFTALRAGADAAIPIPFSWGLRQFSPMCRGQLMRASVR